MNKTLLAISVFCLAVSGCATTRELKPVNYEREGTPASFLFFYELDAAHPLIMEAGCTLELQPRGVGEAFTVKLPYGQNWVHVEGVPGQYVPRTARCGRGTISAERWFGNQGIVLENGKMSVSGMLKLSFANELDLSVGYDDASKAQAAIRKVFVGLPLRFQKNAISAYTAKPLTAVMLASDTQQSTKLRVTGLPGSDRLAADSLFSALDVCNRVENLSMLPHFGRLKWIASYHDGTLASLAKPVNLHTFSDEFVRCTETALSEFAATKEARGVRRFQIELTM